MQAKNAILGALLVSVVTLIVLPIMFGDAPQIGGRAGGDPLRNWVYDFQTLIAGIAAVVAAALTISVMEKTDTNQEIRHRELVELTLRSERLKIERALYPQLEELDAVRRGVVEIDPTEELSKLSFTVYQLSKRLRDIFGREHFIEGATYFPGRLTHAVYRLRMISEQSYQAADHATDYFGDPHSSDEEDFRFSEWCDVGNESHLRFFRSRSLPHLDTAVEEARTLATSYRLQSEGALMSVV